MLSSVAVLSASGKRLMPTTTYRARRLLKSGRAAIYKYRPIFTIQLVGRMEGDTQPIEYKSDTGYQHVGISICSETKEHVNRQLDMLKDESERHNDQKKYRRTRRNHLRYRKPRFDNRRAKFNKCESESSKWLAPSVQHRMDNQINYYKAFLAVMPITSAVFEMGKFDTQLLAAVESGSSTPEGTDYQHGEQYGYETLRQAVFARDGYTCVVCGKSAFKNGIIVRMHHLGYRQGDRTNRMNNLVTVCTGCHTAENHQPGGKLYNLRPRLKNFKGASYMTAVRYEMIRLIKEASAGVDVQITYGAATKLSRQELGVKKTHSNDAYVMGQYHPKHRADFALYEKRRRNNRILARFYDAKYIDTRDGSKKSGAQLSCGRTNRSESRRSDKSLRCFRGQQARKGRVSVRTQRYQIQPDDTIIVDGKQLVASGCCSYGKSIRLRSGGYVSTKKVQTVVHCGGWVKQ